MFYKIVKNSAIVDAMESVSYVRQNAINKVVIACQPEVANGIVSSDGSVVWHLQGQPQFVNGNFETVQLVEITEEEYNTIMLVLREEESINTDDERIREPLTSTEVLERIDALQRQVNELTEQNTQLLEQIQTLRS